MSVAVMTNTPLPDVWRLPVSTLMHYYSRIPEVLPLVNAFAAGPEAKPVVPDDAMVELIGRGL